MPVVDITWRECPRAKLRTMRGYQPPEPYDTQIEVDFPNMLTGEDAAASLIEANVDADPESWDAFEYVVEILAPDHLAGRYAVEIVMEPTVEAIRITEEAA